MAATTITGTATTPTTAAATDQRPIISLAIDGVRHMASLLGKALSTVRCAWTDVVDSGQFGPAFDRDASRHAGARI
jgi:hypothetical protein